MTLWGGRFEGESDPLFRAINDSLRIDHRLVQDDIEGSIAWADALARAGVLTADEASRITAALGDVARTARDDPGAVGRAGDEDVHAWVERQLVARVGDLGKKLHAGRSRNDQVATDLRLWTRRAIATRRGELRTARLALIDLAEREEKTVMPGYTHLQRAQPVLFAHWCLAYAEMLRRDDRRLADAAAGAGDCPLGAAALAGTAYPIDRARLASALGFARPCANSLDAVSDRDFVVETLSALALCSVHLSRLAEDLIFFNSAEAGYVELGDAVTSGSSIMPQKKNPDALELLRGKTGSMLGALIALATTLKGLPLAYNKDMQEDKSPLFAAMDDLALCLRIVPPVLDGLTVHAEATRRAAQESYANATELADYLATRGVPFRDAHDMVGRLVLLAIKRGVALEDLPLATLREVAPMVDEDVFAHLALDATLTKRGAFGGTAPERVREAIAAARAALEVRPE